MTIYSDGMHIEGDLVETASVDVGMTTTLSPGQPATVVNSGTNINAVFDFGIPQGEKGDPGQDSQPTYTFSVATNSSGNAIIDISHLGLVRAPNVQATLIGGNDADDWRVVSRSNTSVTIRATRRGSVNLLAVQVPLFVSTGINGARIDVVVRSND